MNQPRRIAALCVGPKSAYRSMAGVDCYTQRIDARTFDGSCPIVAHPPCRAWSATCRHQSAHSEAEKALGPFCVDLLRQCGGVLEHPAHSRLWDHCGLIKPSDPGSLQGELISIAVSQVWWGHPIKKKTWLLLSGIDPDALEFPFTLHNTGKDWIAFRKMSTAARSRTCPGFAQWLVDAARTTTKRPEAEAGEREGKQQHDPARPLPSRRPL